MKPGMSPAFQSACCRAITVRMALSAEVVSAAKTIVLRREKRRRERNMENLDRDWADALRAEGQVFFNDTERESAEMVRWNGVLRRGDEMGA